MKEYSTILENGSDEIIEKKSKFIGYVCHVESESEAETFITAIKKKHYDARHNCYAYVIGQEKQLIRFSDDGEPGGTAGKPILEVITGLKLCDVCIVVTRYFGGTLLGTGGLVRAYTEASKAALCTVKVVRKHLVMPITITTNYTDLGKIQYLFGNEKIAIIDSEYGQDVILKAEIFVDDVKRIEKAIIEVTAARATLEFGEVLFSICREESV